MTTPPVTDNYRIYDRYDRYDGDDGDWDKQRILFRSLVRFEQSLMQERFGRQR